MEKLKTSQQEWHTRYRLAQSIPESNTALVTEHAVSEGMISDSEESRANLAYKMGAVQHIVFQHAEPYFEEIKDSLTPQLIETATLMAQFGELRRKPKDMKGGEKNGNK